MIDQIVMSVLAALAFVILFNAPKKEYVFCAWNGCLGWMSYQLFLGCGVGNVVASLWATLILTLAARILSALRRTPVTIFLIPGIFTLVPGAGIYYASYYLIMNDLARFSAKGIETFKIAGAMVLGIIFGLALPQSWFNRLKRLAEKRRQRRTH